MKYRDILGFEKKKTPTKEKQLKPKKNQILEGIKKDLNEWNDTTFRGKPKRWSGASDKGLTEHEQELKEVGSAAEYRPHIKRINKLYDEYGAAVGDFQTLLKKKGLKKEAKGISMVFGKLVMKFHNTLNKMLGKLM